MPEKNMYDCTICTICRDWHRFPIRSKEDRTKLIVCCDECGYQEPADEKNMPGVDLSSY